MSARYAGLIALFFGACHWEHSTFHCVDAGACVSGKIVGTCEANGFCSFPDSKCASGNRYGSFSGSLSGECIGDEVDGGPNPSDAGVRDAGSGALTISPASLLIYRGQTQTFVASNPSATLTVKEGASGGTFTNTNVYHPPGGTGTVTAHIVATFGTATATATVTVKDNTLNTFTTAVNEPLGLTGSVDGLAIVAAHDTTMQSASLWYLAFGNGGGSGAVLTPATARDVVHTNTLLYFTTFETYTDGAVRSMDNNGTVAPVYSTNLSRPEGLALGPNNTLYIANSQHNVVQSISYTGGNPQTIAGLFDASGTADGIGTAARFNYPVRLVFDGVDTLYVSDANNHTVRTISVSTGTVATPWGQPTVTGTDDGVGNSARFNGPQALTLDTSGHLYVADAYNHTVRRIDLGTKAVSTFIGDPGRGTGATGSLTTAALGFPSGLTFDAYNDLYVADYSSNAIYYLTLTP